MEEVEKCEGRSGDKATSIGEVKKDAMVDEAHVISRMRAIRGCSKQISGRKGETPILDHSPAISNRKKEVVIERPVVSQKNAAVRIQPS